MENTKRARREKSRIRPSAETYVKPKGLLSGLERVREVVVNASALLPEVGARCVSSARRDLCGGCRVTGIPTATKYFNNSLARKLCLSIEGAFGKRRDKPA